MIGPSQPAAFLLKYIAGDLAVGPTDYIAALIPSGNGRPPAYKVAGASLKVDHGLVDFSEGERA